MTLRVRGIAHDWLGGHGVGNKVGDVNDGFG